FYETIYPNHPYGRSLSGYKATVSAIERNDLLEFYHQYYTPVGAVIAVVGDVQTNQVLELLGQYLGDWRGPEANQLMPAPQPPTSVQRVTIPMADKVQ